MSLYSIFVHVPESHLEQVKQAMFAAGAGHIGNYSCCSWQVKGEGQFMSEAGSHAYCGQVGVVEKVAEYKIEMPCAQASLPQVIAALQRAHPYEVPAYGVVKLEDF